MATTSIYGADAVALAGSPVQRLLLARNLGGGALPADECMLQELCALAGSDGRRQRRQRRRAARDRAPRRSDRFPIELEARAPGEPSGLPG